jgi:hypothetical protein
MSDFLRLLTRQSDLANRLPESPGGRCGAALWTICRGARLPAGLSPLDSKVYRIVLVPYHGHRFQHAKENLSCFESENRPLDGWLSSPW